MNRKELISDFAGKTGLTKAEARRNITALIELFSATLGKGDKINLSGFGVFEVRVRVARNGRNPRTGETLIIKSAKVPVFKSSPALKAATNCE